MSTSAVDEEAADTILCCCASCGKAEVDDVKLKICTARHRLGCYEGNAGRYERAIKHYIIAATLGYDDGVEAVKAGFVDGVASKEDYEAALRGHQAAVDATKSEQRDEAYAFYNLSP